MTETDKIVDEWALHPWNNVEDLDDYSLRTDELKSRLNEYFNTHRSPEIKTRNGVVGVHGSVSHTLDKGTKLETTNNYGESRKAKVKRMGRRKVLLCDSEHSHFESCYEERIEVKI